MSSTKLPIFLRITLLKIIREKHRDDNLIAQNAAQSFVSYYNAEVNCLSVDKQYNLS